MTRSSFWFALSVLLACGGCAMRQQGYPEPRTQPASTQELDSAHKQIAELQDRITARRGDVQIITERPTSGDPRCVRVSQAAAEICDAASRICIISRDLGDEDATRACRMAQKDCFDARSAADRCTH